MAHEAKPDAPAAPRAPVRRTWLRRLAAHRLKRVTLIYVAALAALAGCAIGAHLYAYFGWDFIAEHALQSLPVPGLFTLMRLISVPGDGWHSHALTAATCLIFLLRGRRTETAALLFCVGGGSTLNTLVKLLVARPRPAAALVHVYHALPSKSFPSGHVTFYVCYFGFLYFAAYATLPRRTWRRRLALALTALPVLSVGLARIYLGEHWPSDTLGAYLLSGLWLALTLHLYRHWKLHSTFHPAELARRAETGA